MNDQRLRWLLTVGALSIIGALALVALSSARPRSAANGALSGVFEVIANAAPATQAAPNAAPVLVELFTSEGCSSCPPADAVLARLEHSQPIDGVRVVPLAHHVDYWNGLGWPDPFSSPQATLRQQAYQALGSGIYTPQAVIDGRYEVNGSSRAALGKA